MVERDDVAAQFVGHQLGAVADAEDGDAPGPDGRVRPWGVGVVDRVRAAGQDDRPGAPALEFGERRVVRQQLGVDVQFADAPGDQLGELAAEVEDDDGRALLLVRGGRAIVGRAIRGRGFQRGLEIGLDLGVVGGQDPVTGVGLLAVDRLATLPGSPAARPVGGVEAASDASSVGSPVASVIARCRPPCRVRPVYPGRVRARRQCRPPGAASAVAHRLGGHREVALEFGGDVVGRGGGGDGRPHVDQPAIALDGPDRERRVTHPEARMAALLVVGRRAAPVLDEEEGQPVAGAAQGPVPGRAGG